MLFVYSPCRESAGVGARTAPRNFTSIVSTFRRQLCMVVMCGCGCRVVCRRRSVLRRRLGMVIVSLFGWCTFGSHPFGLPTILRDISSYSLEYLPAFYGPWATTHLSHLLTCASPAQCHKLCRWRGQRHRCFCSSDRLLSRR